MDIALVLLQGAALGLWLGWFVARVGELEQEVQALRLHTKELQRQVDGMADAEHDDRSYEVMKPSAWWAYRDSTNSGACGPVSTGGSK